MLFPVFAVEIEASPGTGRTIQADPGIGNRSSVVKTFHFKQPPFELGTLRTDQCRCIRNREIRGVIFWGDKQYGVMPCEILLLAESEWRTAPTAAIIGTGMATSSDAFSFAEASDAVIGRQCHRKIRGSISERSIHMTNGQFPFFPGLAKSVANNIAE